MPVMAKESPRALMIGRVAERDDVGIDTIRLYQRRELLPEAQRTCPIIEARSDAQELDDLPALAGKNHLGSLS
jgi:hypothetical protein